MPTRVQIGPNEALDVEVLSPTQVRARYAGGGQGPEDVVVTTSAGSATAAGGFTHVDRPRPPTIETITPDSGYGGTVVIITGTGFEE